MAGGEVAAALLKEAQQEIALLRTDLFNTRRLAEERRQAIDALQSERELLTRHCDDVEASLRAANSKLNHVPELQQRCSHLEAELKRLQTEIETSLAARRILQQELDDERRQRAALMEQKALLEGDRARLAKQRDDLAAQLRVAQHKAREAEEEQVRAEEDAAALRAEVAALQQAAASAASAASGVSANGGLPGPNGTAAAPSAVDTAAAIAATVAAATTPLLEQLEHERTRTTALLGSLHAAKSEIIELTQKVSDYEARHTDMLARGHHDPEQLGHQLALLREQNGALVAQLAAAEERTRQLEGESEALHATAAAPPSMMAVAPHPPPDVPSVASRLLGLAGRIASTSSLYGAGNGSEAGGHGDVAGAEMMVEDVARLRQQVLRFKASRDKLLLEIDKQWGEIERLSAENASLSDELRAQRALAMNWERQAQDGIAQVDQLKDLLEDSAHWSMAAVPSTPGTPPPVSNGADGEGRSVQSLQAELLIEKARATDLELQVRAMAAELLRCQHSNLDLGKSFLPMMVGVEKRLAELCRKARSN
ncbi:hypothetical protein Vretimale_10779 [Volvox reticuliferus]|uniref:Uncharacterized protein n=1 Tax=Volvox reticuliferus TaxID=1737510 RepID=A0A8J4LR38_9CHLO|nr:hypothetical protein Vretifemale_13789 [Volvox reticuliferus]GIM06501.1 hypothetical protein Vretimale_10779 [Volvox reticuliferus]